MGKAPTGGSGLPHDVGVRSAADPASDDTALSAAVSAAQDGDEDAFRVLYRTIQPGLIRYLWVQVGAAAEDVASETWLQVARDLRKFRGDAAGFRGWVATIARHRALDHVRHQRRLPPADGMLEEAGELRAEDDTARSAIDALSTRDAFALIARLPHDQGKRYCCGWSWAWTRRPPRKCSASARVRYAPPPTAACAGSPPTSRRQTEMPAPWRNAP
jgi:RNA polymerase sigma-70 factor (ECF subfamily)